jgi:hypothetical protein
MDAWEAHPTARSRWREALGLLGVKREESAYIGALREAGIIEWEREKLKVES